MNETNLRLIRAIRRRWPNPDERAAALGVSRRHLRRWELDEDVPQILQRLIDLNVVAIVDPSDRDEADASWQSAPFGRARKVLSADESPPDAPALADCLD